MKFIFNMCLFCAILYLLQLTAVGTQAADSKAAPITWSTDESSQSKLQIDDGKAVVVNNSSTPLQQSLTIIQSPGISSIQYGIKGELRSEGVEGMAFLEMWSYFPNGSYYFTKTLGQANGPMGVISGDNSWREFILPFDRTGAPAPTKIELKLVMPGKGKIELRNAVLADEPLIQSPTSLVDGWLVWLVGASVAVAALVVGLTAIAVTFLRQRQRSELRKMSALDIT